MPTLGRPLVHFLKLTILDVLEKQSVSHADNLWGRFCEFYRAVLFVEGPVQIIGIVDLLNFRAALTIETVWKLGLVRVLLERATRLGYPLVTSEASAYLQDAVIQGNPKGNDVRLRDPERGAFTTIELEGLNAALNDGFVEGTVDLPDYALCHVMLAFGPRPRQIAALKERDLISAASKDGTRVYSLKVPRAKQRGELTRASFKLRPCDRRLGELLERLLTHNLGLKTGKSGVADQDWPLFIASQKGEVGGFAYHRTAAEVGHRVQQTFERVEAVELPRSRALQYWI